MGMNLQTRRCACNAVFPLATLRSRETECYACQRKRADRMVSAALAAGQLVQSKKPSLSNLTLDYSPSAQPKPAARQAVVAGQFFETRNEAELACPYGWELFGEPMGGYRIRPVGWRPERKPVARPAPIDLRDTYEADVSARIERARQRLLAARAHADQVKAEQRAGSGIECPCVSCDMKRRERLHAAGMLSRGQVYAGTVQAGDKLVTVIADPSVPTGKVFMRYTGPDGSPQWRQANASAFGVSP